MPHISTEDRDPCPRCSNPARHYFGEQSHGPRLHQFEGWNCPSCGLVSEADGYLPEELRERLLVKFGRFSVFILTEDRPRLLAAFRQLTTLPLQDVYALARRMPGAYERGLTQPQATALAERVSSTGLLAEVRSD